MKKNTTVYFITALLALSPFLFNSCKTDTVSEPSPLGPSSIGVILGLTANPNVIVAGETNRQISTITAKLAKYDGIPLSGRTILFELLNSAGRRSSLGYLEGKVNMLSVVTDSSGLAQTQYYGPLKGDVRSNTDVYVRATVVWEGSQEIQDSIQLYIIRGD